MQRPRGWGSEGGMIETGQAVGIRETIGVVWNFKLDILG
jgi:hypothetical protein